MKKRLFEYLARQGENSLLRLLVGAGLILSLGSVFLNIYRAPDLGDDFIRWWEGWLQQMGGQLLGGAIFLIALEWVLARRSSSPTADIAEPAVQDGDTARTQTTMADLYIERLKGADSREARQTVLDEMKKQHLLVGATMNNLDLQGANFYDADMRGISLEGSNLQGAYLIEANLQNAKLSDANLEKAELSWSDLGGAFLGGAKLYGAWLLRTNLEGAFIKDAHYDISTRLPDGTRWQQDIDLERFTSAAHEKFWRPEPGFFGEYPRWYQKKQGR